MMILVLSTLVLLRLNAQRVFRFELVRARQAFDRIQNRRAARVNLFMSTVTLIRGQLSKPYRVGDPSLLVSVKFRLFV
jgi:hypothetical protein